MIESPQDLRDLYRAAQTQSLKNFRNACQAAYAFETELKVIAADESALHRTREETAWIARTTEERQQDRINKLIKLVVLEVIFKIGGETGYRLGPLWLPHYVGDNADEALASLCKLLESDQIRTASSPTVQAKLRLYLDELQRCEQRERDETTAPVKSSYYRHRGSAVVLNADILRAARNRNVEIITAQNQLKEDLTAQFSAWLRYRETEESVARQLRTFITKKPPQPEPECRCSCRCPGANIAPLPPDPRFEGVRRI